jgi:hypothetical protein
VSDPFDIFSAPGEEMHSPDYKPGKKKRATKKKSGKILAPSEGQSYRLAELPHGSYFVLPKSHRCGRLSFEIGGTPFVAWEGADPKERLAMPPDTQVLYHGRKR